MFLYASWSQWPRCRRRGFNFTRFLGLRVRIPTGVFTPVSCECCVLSDRVLFFGLITRPEKSYRVCCVWMWSRSVDNEGTLDQLELLSHEKKTKNDKKKSDPEIVTTFCSEVFRGFGHWQLFEQIRQEFLQALCFFLFQYFSVHSDTVSIYEVNTNINIHEMS